MSALLRLAARNGRVLMIAGLALGIGIPPLAEAMKPWIGVIIAMMIFFTALRIGPAQALGAARDIRFTIWAAILFQLVLPFIMAAGFLSLGWTGVMATALVLMAAAAPISGSPSLTLMCGHDPAPSLRLLIISMALMPLTILPVFWLLPDMSNAGNILMVSLRLLLIILLGSAAGFAIHARYLRRADPETMKTLDGAMAICMGVIVIGLMSAVGPAIFEDPSMLLLNLAVAFAVNFGLQIGTTYWFAARGREDIAVAMGISAGNRNMSIFLAALPLAWMEPVLLFLGCYQIPMYLTPMLLSWLHRQR